MTPIPNAVYVAARRAYLLSSTDLFTDDETVRAWADCRWPDVPEPTPGDLAFWVLSMAAQDGRE